jgi:hypothetical protein
MSTIKIQFHTASANWTFGVPARNISEEPFVVKDENFRYEILNCENTHLGKLHIIISVLHKLGLKKIPILQKIAAKRVLKTIDHNSDLILGITFFTHFRMVYNDYFFNYLKQNHRGKVIVYFQDTFKFVTFFTERDFKKSLINRLSDDVFYNDYTFNVDDLRLSQRLKHLPLPTNLEIIKNYEVLINSDYYHPHEFELTGFAGVVVGSEKSKQMLAFLSQIDKFKIKLGLEWKSVNGGLDPIFDEHNNLPDLRKQIPSGNFVNRILNTDCVLHISEDDYLSMTIFEAVYFNKKILMTAKSVVNEPWYDPKFIRLFDPYNLTKEDIEWVKAKGDVDYKNKESLKIENFLKKLIS